MRRAGFALHEPRPEKPEPGIWLARVEVDGERLTVPVDLIVPEGAAAAGGRRGARLGAHGNRAARRAVGLEAALVDRDPLTISALDAGDPRSFEVDVAGPAALLIAKAHKIHDRLDSPRDRADDKDAADVYRLMQTTRPAEVGERIAQLRHDRLAGPATDAGIGYLFELFGRRGGQGIAMAARALRLAIPEDEIDALATAYIRRLSSALAAAG